MNTVTYEEIIAMDPCWLNTPAGRRRLKRYADCLGGKATALDILGLKRVLVTDRFWMVLREDFIAAPILHEFACRCAERALKTTGVTDKRSWDAIQAKRDWLAGKIDDQQLAAVRDAVWGEWSVAWSAAYGVARDATWSAAWSAAEDAARHAARTTEQDAALAAARATRDAERDWQITELTNMLQGAEPKKEAAHDQ